MGSLETIIESIRSSSSKANGKTAVKNLGFFSCANRLDIKHVPFYEPCLILVLKGRKVLFEGQTPIACEAGSVLTVPGPSSHDLRNEPDPRTRQYRALLIPFKAEHLERMMRAYGLMHEVPHAPVGILKFAADPGLHASIEHYLSTEGSAKLLSHRLMEILLVLATKNPTLLAYALQKQGWCGRVRTVLASDLAQPWGNRRNMRAARHDRKHLAAPPQARGQQFSRIIERVAADHRIDAAAADQPPHLPHRLRLRLSISFAFQQQLP